MALSDRAKTGHSREDVKQATRRRILAEAKHEYIARGYFGFSTAELARKSRVAQGTIFFHFTDKEGLFREVLDGELMRISGELRDSLKGLSGFEEMLERYLDYLEGEEDFFAVLARETPLYPAPLRRFVMGRECAIREPFRAALEAGASPGKRALVDPATILNVIFGTLAYHLGLREAFAADGGVIREKRAGLSAAFRALLAARP